MNYEVIDDFLNDEDFNEIKNTMFSEAFPWFYSKTKTSENEKEDLDNFQFAHLFYSNYAPNSDFMKLIVPILTKLNPLALARIKANMTMRTQNIIEYGYHTDYTTDTKLKTAVFYLNSNNGYTKFENEVSVESIENRIVIFDSQILHTGSSCTDQRFRALINLNFYL